MATNDNLITEEELENSQLAVWPALDLPLIEHLPNPIPVAQLLDNGIFETIKKLVYEAIRINSNSDAIELIHRLKLVESIRATNPQLYDSCQQLIILLRFVSFVSRKQKDARYLLSGNLISALKAGVKVGTNLADFLEVYEGELGADKTMRRELTHALDTNQEKIGEQAINLEGKGKVAPTLQNWLASYNLSQSLKTNRNKFNQINFFNNNSDARSLENNNKILLGQALKIYDMLLFPPPGPEVVYDETQPLNKFLNDLKGFSIETFTLPPGLINQEPKAQPIIPRPFTKQASSQVLPSINLVQKPPVIPSAKPVSAPVTAGKVKVPGKVEGWDLSQEKPVDILRTFSPVNIQDILKSKQQTANSRQQTAQDQSGINIGGLTPGQMEGQSRANGVKGDNGINGATNPVSDIDKKLEELKKRRGSN